MPSPLQSPNPPQPPNPHPDSDLRKGAEEDDTVHKQGERATEHGSLCGQIGHRSLDTQPGGMGDGEDSDFPEPGDSPEHSGQHS
jgi:hypothetical protein